MWQVCAQAMAARGLGKLWDRRREWMGINGDGIGIYATTRTSGGRAWGEGFARGEGLRFSAILFCRRDTPQRALVMRVMAAPTARRSPACFCPCAYGATLLLQPSADLHTAAVLDSPVCQDALSWLKRRRKQSAAERCLEASQPATCPHKSRFSASRGRLSSC